jgi:hypothetical protein
VQRFYYAAQHLVLQHNKCRHFLCDPTLEKTFTHHLIISNPFGFLEWLLTIPPHAQADVLRYCNRIIFISPARWRPMEVPPLLAGRIRDELPHLDAVLSRLCCDLFLKDDNNCQLGPSLLFSPGFDTSSYGNYSSRLPPLDYRLVFLGLFSNLESLALTAPHLIHVHTSLLHPVWQRNLGTIFCNLKEIYIRDSMYWSHSTITPFLQLPNLQLLLLELFNQCREIVCHRPE